ARSRRPAAHSHRGRRAVTGLDAEAWMRRATAKGDAPTKSPPANAMTPRGRARQPAAIKPAKAPARAGIARAESQIARPQTSPRIKERTNERGREVSARECSPASTGTETRSGIRKFGVGPVAAMSAMYGVPTAASAAAAHAAIRP